MELLKRLYTINSKSGHEAEIKAIADFARSLRAVEEYHLLPYHRLGTDKYTGLGRTYTLPEIEPPTKEKMQYLLSVAETSGLKCQIGG